MPDETLELRRDLAIKFIKDSLDDVFGYFKEAVLNVKIKTIWNELDSIEKELDELKKQAAPSFSEIFLDVIISMAIQYAVPFIVAGVAHSIMKKSAERTTDLLININYSSRSISKETYRGIVEKIVNQSRGNARIVSSIKLEKISQIVHANNLIVNTLKAPDSSADGLIKISSDFLEKMAGDLYDSFKSEATSANIKSTVASLSYEKIKTIDGLVTQIESAKSRIYLSVREKILKINDSFYVNWLYDFANIINTSFIPANFETIKVVLNDIIQNYINDILLSGFSGSSNGGSLRILAVTYRGAGHPDTRKEYPYLLSETARDIDWGTYKKLYVDVWNVYQAAEWKVFTEYLNTLSYSNRNDAPPEKLTPSGFSYYIEVKRRVFFNIFKIGKFYKQVIYQAEVVKYADAKNITQEIIHSNYITIKHLGIGYIQPTRSVILLSLDNMEIGTLDPQKPESEPEPIGNGGKRINVSNFYYMGTDVNGVMNAVNPA